MVQYISAYRSNEVSIDVHEFINIIDEYDVNFLGVKPRGTRPAPPVDGLPQYHLTDEDDDASVWFGDTGTTFEVWDHDDGNVTEQFLEDISACMDEGETLVIRSVGYEGLRHIPDAWQWVVDSDGTVENEQFDHPK